MTVIQFPNSPPPPLADDDSMPLADAVEAVRFAGFDRYGHFGPVRYSISALSDGETHFVVLAEDGDTVMMFGVDDCGRVRNKLDFEERLENAVRWMRRREMPEVKAKLAMLDTVSAK